MRFPRATLSRSIPLAGVDGPLTPLDGIQVDGQDPPLDPRRPVLEIRPRVA